MRIRTLTLAATATALAATGLALPAAAAAAPTAPAAPKATSATTATTATSDFNGDGYDDLAVGVPDGTVRGKAKAGYVNVVWGGRNGLGAHGSTRVSQDTAGVPGAPETEDRFGAAVATADVDRDGRADLLIGVPGEDLVSPDAGTVTLVHGAERGFGTSFPVADGADHLGGLGQSLAAADFSGDRRVDVAMGAKDKVFLATPDPLEINPREYALVMGDRMGGRAPVLATGDFDADAGHRPDLAIAYYTKNQPYTQSHVRLYSWREDTGADGRLENFWNTDNAAASALAAGDFDGDGHDDLALGNCREIADENIDDPCGPEELHKGGGVHIEYGDAGGSFGRRTQTFNQDTPGIPGVAETGDDFGAALTAADYNGDGRDELVMGAPGEAIGARKKAGSATIVFGGEDGLLDEAGNATSVAYQQNTTGVPGVAETGDRFGAALAAADYDKNGRPDLAVGAPGENASSGGVWMLPSVRPSTPWTAMTPKSLGLPAPSSPLAYGAVLGR